MRETRGCAKQQEQRTRRKKGAELLQACSPTLQTSDLVLAARGRRSQGAKRLVFEPLARNAQIVFLPTESSHRRLVQWFNAGSFANTRLSAGVLIIFVSIHDLLSPFHSLLTLHTTRVAGLKQRNRVPTTRITPRPAGQSLPSTASATNWTASWDDPRDHPARLRSVGAARPFQAWYSRGPACSPHSISTYSGLRGWVSYLVGPAISPCYRYGLRWSNSEKGFGILGLVCEASAWLFASVWWKMTPGKRPEADHDARGKEVLL